MSQPPCIYYRSDNLIQTRIVPSVRIPGHIPFCNGTCHSRLAPSPYKCRTGTLASPAWDTRNGRNHCEKTTKVLGQLEFSMTDGVIYSHLCPTLMPNHQEKEKAEYHAKAAKSSMVQLLLVAHHLCMRSLCQDNFFWLSLAYWIAFILT